MDASYEQRVNVKFCYKLGKTFSETFEMIRTVYGDNSLSRTQCYEWFRRFKEGRELVEDDHRSGRPSTSTDDFHVNQVNELVRSNRRLTVREMADDCDISFGSCQTILSEHLGMRRIAAKLVPRLLSDEQGLKNKWTIASQPARTPRSRQRGRKFSDNNNNRRRNLGLRLRRWNQGSILSVDWKGVPKAEEGKTGEIECESDVNCFLWRQWCRTSRISTTRRDGEPVLLPSSSSSFAREHSKKETRSVEIKIVGSSSWQCSCSFLLTHSRLLRQNGDNRASPASLLAWSCPRGLFSLPEVEGHPERAQIWHCGRNQAEFVGAASDDTKKRLPNRLPELETSLGTMYH